MMTVQSEFQERIVHVEWPSHHFKFLVAQNGAMLGLDDAQDLVLCDESR